MYLRYELVFDMSDDLSTNVEIQEKTSETSLPISSGTVSLNLHGFIAQH